MQLEYLFVSMMYKCQHFFNLALICCLTFYNSHLNLHGILEEFLFKLLFHVFFHSHGLFLHLW